MAKNRNNKVFITSIAVFIFGVISLYDGIIRLEAQTPSGILLDFAIIGISIYGFYLFITRTRDMFRHPDVRRFLTFDNPRQYIELFEQEATDKGRKTFRNGFITRSFIVTETFYRFRWAYAKEICRAYVERARGPLHAVPIPFIGSSTVVVHLGNGTVRYINCNSEDEAEALLKQIVKMSPSASCGACTDEKPDLPADYDGIAKDVADTIRQMPDLKLNDKLKSKTKSIEGARAPGARVPPQVTNMKTGAMAEKLFKTTPAGRVAATLQPVPARQLSKEELYGRQVQSLYDSLEKEDIATALTNIDAIGNTMNVSAVDILVMLLEYPDETVRARATFMLGQLGLQSSVEGLIKALDDRSVQVRENAAVALGKIGDQRAVAPLQQVSPQDVRVKKAAVNALSRIDQKLKIFNQPGPGLFNTLK